MAIKLPKDESTILTQVETEYRLAYDFIAPKRMENLDRLKLYSNQKKNKELVGDTLLFTVFNTVHSKLYDDRLGVVFAPGHADDTVKVDALQFVAKYDYYKFHKDQFDFDWDWYACFWGSGFLDVSAWNSKKKIMMPSVVNNFTLLIDPNGTLVNGDQRGFGAFLFWGREIAKTKNQMKSESGYEDFESLNPSSDYTSLQYQFKVAQAVAQNTALQPVPVQFENDLIPLLEWWTHIDGKKYLIVTDLGFTKVVRCKEHTNKKWPLIQRKLFPIPNDPLGVSIPDLTEDKQRAKSVLTNLGLNVAKSNLYPMRLYDRNAISPTSDFTFGFNKWIPVDGNPNEAHTTLQKQDPGQIVSYIMDLIDQGAQKATAATSMQQGVQSEKPRSANEVVRVFDAAEARISTAAKVFGWSEREFWEWWLENYQTYFSSAHEKFVRIDGAFGPKFINISGDNFSFVEDPDIFIESKVLNDAKNQDAKQDAIAFSNLIAQDQTVNRRYNNKRNARLFGYSTEEVNRLYPQTPDEMIAEQENDSLNRNKMVKIHINDDHVTHLLAHANADDTHAAIVHIEAHKKALMIKRTMNQNDPNVQTPANPGEMPTSMQGQPSPMGGSAPAARSAKPFAVQ